MLFPLFSPCVTLESLLWLPVWGSSYWAASFQYRALRGGARLGRAIGRNNDVEEYDTHASMLL
jgi:glucoamylase